MLRCQLLCLSLAAHTPDNSFMGFVAEELNETEQLNIQRSKVNNMAVVYGKEASMWKVSEVRAVGTFEMFSFNVLVLFVEVEGLNNSHWMCCGCHEVMAPPSSAASAFLLQDSGLKRDGGGRIVFV